MNYLIPIFTFVIGVLINVRQVEPVYLVTEITVTDTVSLSPAMGFSACLDMFTEGYR